MQVYQLLYVLHLSPHGQLQPTEDGRHHLRTYYIMVMERPSRTGFPALRAGLADVVQQSSPTEVETSLLLYDILQHFQGVVEVILMCPTLFLLHDVESRQLWQDDLQQSRALQVFKADAGMRGHHDFVQFHLDALAADYLDAVSHVLQGLEGLIFNLEIQLGGKADAAHHAQRVVREGNLGVQGSGDDAVFQVGNAIEWVYQLAKAAPVQADGHCIDGEVATVLVVFQRAVLHHRLARVVAVAFLAGSHELHLKAIGLLLLAFS